MISDNASFLRWIEETSRVPASAIESIRADNASAKLDAVFAEARAPRVLVSRVVDDFRGKPLPCSAVGRLRLNAILERDRYFEQIDISDTLKDRIAGLGLKLSSRRVWRSTDMLLNSDRACQNFSYIFERSQRSSAASRR